MIPRTALSLAVLVLFSIHTYGAENRSNPDPEVEKLIGQLTKVDDWNIAYESTEWERPSCRDKNSPYLGRSSAQKMPNPSIKKLVQMGVRSLPGLLDHLQDARKTRLTVSTKQYRNLRYSEIDDPRFSVAPTTSEEETTPKKQYKEKVGSEYTFRVGDICYEIIGLIVNRDLFARQLEWDLDLDAKSPIYMVNSPVHSPALAQKVRADWANLSKGDHAKQLENDAYSLWSEVSSEALIRLLSYYPTEGKLVTIKLLKRHIYDSMSMITYLGKTFKQTDDPAKWAAYIRQTEIKFGKDAAKLIPYWLELGNCYNSKEEQNRIPKIKKAFFPEFDPYKTGFINAATLHDLTDTVKKTRFFWSPMVDQAVLDLLRTVERNLSRTPSRRDGDIVALTLDELGRACVARLKDRGFKRECREFRKFRPKFAAEHIAM
jgi:hypothetical protein